MLRLTGVSKRYTPGRWVLSGVDLDVPAGESVSVLGANGSGKSTLLRLLAGVSRPSCGRITGAAGPIGYVPDRFPATDAMSSIAYLTHIGRIRGLGTAEARRRGGRLLERLDLAGGVRTPIRALSKGNAQKVALSQALLVPPRLLVLDEPWSGLDAAAHGVLGEILTEVVRDGGSVVFTDHRESISRAHAGVSYSIAGGRVERLAGGRVERLATAPRPQAEPVAHVVLTEPGGRGTAAAVDWRGIGGVLDVTVADSGVRIRVRASGCDDLLGHALRQGWSVSEVRREEPSWSH